MSYIKKILASWEVKHGAVFLGGKEYQKNKTILSKFLDSSFKLETFLGNFGNRHVYHEPTDRFLRISCRSFLLN